MLETGTKQANNVAEVRNGQTPVAIEARHIFKTYNGRKAVDGVSFAVLRGEIFGILGPNGA